MNENNCQEMQRLLDDLAWVASLDDVDHEICEIAEHAGKILQLQNKLLQTLLKLDAAREKMT